MKRAVDGRIGARLAEARQARGLSQGKLAQAIGVTVGTIQAYEHSRCRIAVERLEDIAAALECNAADFLTPARRQPAAASRGADRPAATAAPPRARARSGPGRAQAARGMGRAESAPDRRA